MASRFSDDGQWWWDGARWVATAQIVLPALSQTEFERTGQVVEADRSRTYLELFTWGNYLLAFSLIATPVLLAVLVPYFIFQARVFRAYRRWTLEQLALATTHLLGTEEPMLAGETHLWRGVFAIRATRNRAVVVTDSHLLIFGFDSMDGPPRRVELAARSADVSMASAKGLIANRITLVTADRRRWDFTGAGWVFDADPVLAAWRAGRQQPAASAGGRNQPTQRRGG